MVHYIFHPCIYHDLKTVYEKHKEHAKPNISKDELQAAHNLKTDNDLIVKPADKGGVIVRDWS
jgi:hypothetical protein